MTDDDKEEKKDKETNQQQPLFSGSLLSLTSILSPAVGLIEVSLFSNVLLETIRKISGSSDNESRNTAHYNDDGRTS